MEQQSGFLTKILESVFNTHRNDTPIHTIRPFHEWPITKPFDKRPTFGFRPFYERPTMRPFHESPTLSPPLGPHWDSKPPDIKELEPTVNVSAQRLSDQLLVIQRNHRLDDAALDRLRSETEPPSNTVGAFTLEKLLWVVLSGFGVMVLMAIFMKLGGPIRRVRRQLSNVRPAPNDVITVTLRPDVGNMDMTSLLRLSDELPPPYSECVRSSTNKHDTEEPPPRYSACFVSFTNPKDAEPQVHIRRQNDLIKNGLSVESVPMNNSESVAPGVRNKLVFDNGRIVERLSRVLK